MELFATGCCGGQKPKCVRSGMRYIPAGQLHWQISNVVAQTQLLVEEIPEFLTAYGCDGSERIGFSYKCSSSHLQGQDAGQVRGASGIILHSCFYTSTCKVVALIWVKL